MDKSALQLGLKGARLLWPGVLIIKLDLLANCCICGLFWARKRCSSTHFPSRGALEVIRDVLLLACILPDAQMQISQLQTLPSQYHGHGRGVRGFRHLAALHLQLQCFGGKASRVGGGSTRNSHISSHESNVCVCLRPAITTGCFGSDAGGPGNFPRVNAVRGVTCQGQRS